MKRGTHIIEDGKGGKQPDILKRPRDAGGGDLMRLAVRQATVQENSAVGGLIDAGNEIEHGGFAGTIWTDETDQFVAANFRSNDETAVKPPKRIVALLSCNNIEIKKEKGKRKKFLCALFNLGFFQILAQFDNRTANSNVRSSMSRTGFS